MFNSFDLSSITPEQVLQLFQVYLRESRSILDTLITNGNSFEVGENNKYEWMQSQFKPKGWVLNAGGGYSSSAFNTPATMTFVTTAHLEKNMILYFQDANGLDVGNMQVIVLSVTNGTTAQVQIYGGSTGVALAGTEQARFLSESVKENEKNIEGKDEWLPTKEFNNFQIFRTSVELSDTALKTAVHGNVNLLANQLQGAFYQIRQQMSDQLTRGLRVARTNGSLGNGTMGWFLQFLTMAWGNVVNGGGAALTPEMLNNLVSQVDADGGQVDTIICSVEQARKISAFNRTGATGNNVYTMIGEKSNDVGNYAMRFISDIPVAGGLISNIIVDHKMPKNRVGLLKMSNIGLVPFKERSLKLVDGTQNGQDGTTAIVRWEYTLACKDAIYSGGIINNLSV